MHIGLALGALLVQLPLQAAETVIYSWAESRAEDARGYYPVALLKLALQKSGGNYGPKASRYDLSQYRTLRHVELGRGLDVTWTLTNPEREESLRPIRIPIDRGLLGWRLLLIADADVSTFAQLGDAQQLKALRSGQGHDWPDYPILRDNGFKVSPSSSYEGLFQMLQRGHIRYFPRSLTEIQYELDAHPNMGLSIAPQWVLYYPAPVYFFVKKDNAQLAAAIEQGLEIAIRDGSMRELFLQHFGDAIASAQLRHRKIVPLENTQLTPETPVARSDLWFSPEQGF